MNIKIINILKNKSIRNSCWIIGEKVLQMAISFIITTISARYLGPSDYGVLNYGISFVTFFTAIMKLGIDSIIVNELINDSKKEGKILGTSILFRLISSAISILLISIIIYFLNYNNKIIIVTSILQSLVLIFQAIHVLDFWFQSKLKSKYVSIVKIISYVIVTIYKIILLVNKCNVYWFALSTTIDSLIIAICLIILYNKKANYKLEIDIKEGISLLKKSYHFIISGVMVVIYTQIDKVMIGNILGTSFVGIYSAALTLHSSFGFIPEAIIISARPSVYNAKKRSKPEYYKRLKQTFAVVFYVCVLFAALFSVFGKVIVKILYGQQYISAVVPLIILVWAIPFSQLGMARGIWIVSEGLNKYTKKYLIWGALLNTILNLILIKNIGITGAAIATLITEVFTCLISPLLYKDTRKFTKLVKNALMFNFKED